MKRFISVGAIIGLTLPLCFWAAYVLSDHRFEFGSFVMLLWPSSIMLMATESSHSTMSALLICGISLAVNVALYSLFSLIAYAIYSLWRHLDA